MTTLQIFLDGLNDVEFSFVHHYRYALCQQEETRQTLDNEMTRRGLTPAGMWEHIRNIEFQLTNTGCVKCNTQKPPVNHQCPVCLHVNRPNELPTIWDILITDPPWQI